ncbi:hypothetical protein ACIBJI_39980 [Nocardia sp. NPDC050408]
MGGAWKWIIDDGPARLVAGLVAVTGVQAPWIEAGQRARPVPVEGEAAAA